MKNLVVVESPAKVKTISKFLGKDYKVMASQGHLVDLPKGDLGVDVEKSFEPKYVITKRKVIDNLKKEFADKEMLIIASDPDREGEAIGWHVAQRLGVIDKKGRPKKGSSKKIKRIVFTSITRDAVQEAINKPRDIDMNLINAQQARRVLDRLVGYKLSPLLWKKVMFGLSAGRVQSVAVRIIVDREEERLKFNPEEYWRLYLDLIKDKKSTDRVTKLEKDKAKEIEFDGIKFELSKIDGKKAEITNKKDAQKVLDALKVDNVEIDSIQKKESKRYAKPPFITSTLQQAASNKFGYSSKKTMSVAQKLYEAGFITYMRTDSFNIIPTEIDNIRKEVLERYGQKYLSESAVHFKTASSSAQEAHEAIRPTDITKRGDSLKLSGEQQKLYDLIRNRVLATQMAPAIVEIANIETHVKNYTFVANGQRIVFPGFLKAYSEFVSENILPDLDEKDKLNVLNRIAVQNFTEPPARYTEATLIKVMEKYGIGRPSTYAPTISTIMARKYVIKEGRYLVPTDTAFVVNRLLNKYFQEIVDVKFTSELEDDLDKIAEGKVDWVDEISKFYKPFIKNVELGEKKISRDEFTVLGPSDEKCPICGKKMVKKLGRYGAFLSCSDFPKCKGMTSLDGESEEDIKNKPNTEEFKKDYHPAPKTEDGKDFILKRGRFGEFWAHPDYPKVKEVRPLEYRREKLIELYGDIPQTKDKRDYLLKKGRFGFFWAHPDYPKVKDIQRIAKKPEKKETE